jgi:hypothetical protein
VHRYPNVGEYILQFFLSLINQRTSSMGDTEFFDLLSIESVIIHHIVQNRLRQMILQPLGFLANECSA